MSAHRSRRLTDSLPKADQAESLGTASSIARLYDRRHCKTTGVTELWRVRKPSVDGIITRYEGFDAEGELVIQLFDVRKPGIPERGDWRALAETATPLIG